MTMLIVRSWIAPNSNPLFPLPLLPQSSQASTLYSWWFLIKVYALAACSPPGSVCLYCESA